VIPPSDIAESLAPIRAALASGIEVEDLIEAGLPESEEAPSPTMIDRLLRLMGRASAPTPNPERIKVIADGLDVFSADLVRAALELDDPELAEAGDRSHRWGADLWSGDIAVEQAYNQLRDALVQLCKHRARLVIARPIDIP